MPNFLHRDLSDAERWVSAYESFVADLGDGYGMCIYEYTNDLACRHFLEEHRNDPGVQAVWPRVVSADDSLRAILRPTKRCIHGDYPPTWFWYWGYPPNSEELQNDLESIGAL